MNLNRLHSLFGNDMELINKFIDNVLREMPVLLEQLRQASHSMDRPGLRQSAHDLKSLFAYFNAEDLAERALAMELEDFNSPPISLEDVETFIKSANDWLLGLSRLKK